MAEEEQEQEQQADEKLTVELPGLFGRRKRKKQGAPEDDEPAAPLQPFDDEADEPAPEEQDEDVEEAPTPAPHSRFTPPGTATGSPEPDVEQTRQLPDVGPTGPTTEDAGSTGPTDGEKTPKKTRKPLPPLAVSSVVGLFIGVLACGLTYAGMIGCQEIQGTTACGGPGFFVLMAIMVMLVAAGSFLLRTFGIPDPTSTSLLAMGIVAVVALAFLIEVIFAWWMIIVIPLVSAASHAGSHWLTDVFTATEQD